MSGHTRLYRRGAVYYHRAAIPVDIQDTYPKKEETFSLKTREYNEALRLVKIKAVEVDMKFEAHRRSLKLNNRPPIETLSDDQIENLSLIYKAYLLDEDDELRIEGFYEDEQLPDPAHTFEEYETLTEDMDKETRKDKARGKLSDFFIGEAEDVLSWEGVEIKLKDGSPSLMKLARALQSVTIETNELKQQRNKGDVVPTPKSPTAKKHEPLLSEASQVWIDEKMREGTWRETTKEEKIVKLREFIDLVGDKPIDVYDKNDARLFKAALLTLPANWTKKNSLKGMTIGEAVEYSKANSLIPMSEVTASKGIINIASFWSWAIGNYDGVINNPFDKMNIKPNVISKELRNPFTHDDLKVIFSSPIYTGCMSRRKWSTQGSIIPKDSGIYWVPLLALYTGARMQEICQLYISDVLEEKGVLYIDLNIKGDDKSLKKGQGNQRRIPIHRDLFSLGFHEFLKLRQDEKSSRLFPDIAMGSKGKYSDTFSKHFSEVLKKLGIKRPKITFHSFRHSFADACRRAAIPTDVKDALMGHNNGDVGRDYGDGYSIEDMNSYLQKISYNLPILQN